MTERSVDGLTLLHNVLEQTQGEVIKSLLLHALQELMSDEADALCGARYGSRTDERVNRRNGYREREVSTRVGDLTLRIPKLRTGTYLPSFLDARSRWERAFVNVVCEAYVGGVSTR